MPNPKEAKKAIRDLDGSRVCGRKITVELSEAEHCVGKKSSVATKIFIGNLAADEGEKVIS